MGSTGKCITTVIAAKGLYTGMRASMTSQTRRFGETALICVALERFAIGMDPPMPGQMFVVEIMFATHIATKWSSNPMEMMMGSEHVLEGRAKAALIPMVTIWAHIRANRRWK
jgi:hypothetical protein